MCIFQEHLNIPCLKCDNALMFCIASSFLLQHISPRHHSCCDSRPRVDLALMTIDYVEEIYLRSGGIKSHFAQTNSNHLQFSGERLWLGLTATSLMAGDFPRLIIRRYALWTTSGSHSRAEFNDHSAGPCFWTSIQRRASRFSPTHCKTPLFAPKDQGVKNIHVTAKSSDSFGELDWNKAKNKHP